VTDTNHDWLCEGPLPLPYALPHLFCESWDLGGDRRHVNFVHAYATEIGGAEKISGFVSSHFVALRDNQLAGGFQRTRILQVASERGRLLSLLWAADRLLLEHRMSNLLEGGAVVRPFGLFGLLLQVMSVQASRQTSGEESVELAETGMALGSSRGVRDQFE
jgi:hypothetical protein